MKSIRKYHPELAHATPHKLRHTGATLPKQTGTSIKSISEALTPSDMITTKTPMAVGEIAYRCLNNGVNHKVSVNVDIAVLINVLR
jgi:integrase/recombinase, phage integrase family|nr:site-specific integrase [Streptococcus oralis]